MTPANVRILLDLAVATEPISGSIGPEFGPSQDFAGVMQLISALEELRASGGGAAEAVPAGGASGVPGE